VVKKLGSKKTVTKQFSATVLKMDHLAVEQGSWQLPSITLTVAVFSKVSRPSGQIYPFSTFGWKRELDLLGERLGFICEH
jgi:hypothetical protein